MHNYFATVLPITPEHTPPDPLSNAGKHNTEEGGGKDLDDETDFSMRIVALRFLQVLPNTLLAQFLRQERSYFDLFLIPADDGGGEIDKLNLTIA